LEPAGQRSTISAEGRREFGEGETGLVPGDDPVDLVVGQSYLELSGASLTGTIGCRFVVLDSAISSWRLSDRGFESCLTRSTSSWFA